MFALWLVYEKTVEEKTNLKFEFSYFSHFWGVASVFALCLGLIFLHFVMWVWFESFF